MIKFIKRNWGNVLLIIGYLSFFIDLVSRKDWSDLTIITLLCSTIFVQNINLNLKDDIMQIKENSIKTLEKIIREN